MALGLGSLFQNMMKVGVKDAAKQAIPDMVGKMFAKKEPTSDEVLSILEDERRQRALEFIGAQQPDYYQDPRDDAPNIVIPEPLVQTPTGSVIPQQTIVPQVIDAPRGTVVRNLGTIFLELERINANIASITRAMSDSAKLEKKYRDELIKNREQLLAQRDKYRSSERTARSRAQNRGFLGRQLRRGQRKVGGITQGFLDAAMTSLAIEMGGFLVNALTDAFKPDPTTGGRISADSLREMISGGEGGLNSINRGTAGDTPGGARSVLGKDLTQMSVDEVYAAQKAGKIFAAGKYQVTPSTMPGFVNYLKKKGYDTSTSKFDKDIQNMFFDYTLEVKRPIVGKYLRGEDVDINQVITELAAEFAAVGVPRDMRKGEYGGGYPVRNIKKGESLYSGIGGNASSISPESIKRTLEKQRRENLDRIKKGTGGPDLRNQVMPDASKPGAPGIPGDPNSPKIGERVGSMIAPSPNATVAMAPVGERGPNISVIERFYDMALPKEYAGKLNTPNEIPDRNPGGGGIYEQYMGVA